MFGVGGEGLVVVKGGPPIVGCVLGSVEDPEPRSWYVMNSVYFECSVSRTWPHLFASLSAN